MIKKIREIKGIGVFEKHSSPCVQNFDKLSIIFGLNCYGKSTLADIFTSFKRNQPSIISNRKTITGSNELPQSFKATFLHNTQGKELNIIFENGAWISDNFDHVIEVFDNRFVQENVFTGWEVTRSNKENITSFILGEENTKLANDIEQIKKESATIRDEISIIGNTIQTLVPGQSIDLFVNLKIEDTAEFIKTKIQSLTIKQQAINRNKQNASSIQLLEEPVSIKCDYNLPELLTRINQLFAKSFENIHLDAESHLNLHIKKTFNQRDGNEVNWIKDGYQKYVQKNDGKSLCPLCGQGLETATELLSIYKSYFNEEYNRYVSELEDNLSLLVKRFVPLGPFISSQLSQNISIVKDYLKYFSHETLLQNISKLEKSGNEVSDAIASLNIQLETDKAMIDGLISEKMKAPHKSAPQINALKIEELSKKLEGKIGEYSSNVRLLKEMLAAFKAALNTEKVESELKNVAIDIELNNRSLKRIENESLCKKYVELSEKRMSINQSVETKIDELEGRQEIFLDQYFSKINDYFKKLGSHDFKIERSGVIRRGYKPTVGISIKYRNMAISESQYPYIFSESDRRALALSIFWAKIITKSEEERKKTIVIMDDPVTSFDENRLIQFIEEIRLWSECVDQVIVLCHYTNYICNLLKNANSQSGLALFRIEKQGETCLIVPENSEYFTHEKHEKTFFDINAYIDNKLDKDMYNDLRVYLEEELRIRFRKQLIDFSIPPATLGSMVDGLIENNLVSSDLAKKLGNYKKILNPGHHVFQNYNIETKKAFAYELIEFIYKNLNPA